MHLEGEEECPIPELADEGVHCAGPLRYTLDVGISEGALWANGSLAQPVELPLRLVPRAFPYTIEVQISLSTSSFTGPELVDLTPYIREDISSIFRHIRIVIAKGDAFARLRKPTAAAPKPRGTGNVSLIGACWIS